VCVLAGLAGADGDAAEARHRAATRRVVAGLGLAPHDRVYVSRLCDERGSRVSRVAARAWGEELGSVTPAQVVPYGVEAFTPWA
jgi:hypothetical protein